VFAPAISSAAQGTTVTTNFRVDAQIMQYRFGESAVVADRLRGVSNVSPAQYVPTLRTAVTDAESSEPYAQQWNNTSFQIAGNPASAPFVYWNFQRAPSFFDEVCYPGTWGVKTVNHNLGVVPELIIFKQRNGTNGWAVYAASQGVDKYAFLYTEWAFGNGTILNSTAPTSSVFTVSGSGEPLVNEAGGTYVAYLFATCAGVSKVGSYTGNGSSQTINCGFTGGARFVLIKRADSTGNWYVWDTARGIVSGNDPHLSLNTTAAEVSSNDTIDPDSSGFIVNQVTATNVNVSSATYIYLAIA
jgi:hypothetical protein